MNIWPGHTVATTIIDIEHPIEWELLRGGRKSQMRSKHRLHDPDMPTPSLVMLRCRDEAIPFVVETVWREELVVMKDDDAVAEGFADLPTFKRHWCSKEADAYFSPSERVWVYNLIGPWNPDDVLSGKRNVSLAEKSAVRRLVESLYPSNVR